jgi:hypothetical protein
VHSQNGEPVRALLPPRFLQVLAALVFAAAAVAAARSLDREFTRAFRGPRTGVFPPSVLGQLQILRSRLPAGSTVLLVSGSSAAETWNARMFQRGLYPGNAVIVLFVPVPDAVAMARLRGRHGLRYAISMGDPPADPGFLQHEDLGPLPDSDERVWFGELAR